MLKIIWPLLFVFLGMLTYALASNPKAAEAGRLTFACGMLWLVYLLSHASFAFNP